MGTPIDPYLVGARLKAAREAKGLSQGDLAKLISPTANAQRISQWEVAGKLPSLESIRRLRAAIGCPLRDLVPELFED